MSTKVPYWNVVEKCLDHSKGGKVLRQIVFEALNENMEKILNGDGSQKTERKTMFNINEDLLHLVRDLPVGHLKQPIMVDNNFKPVSKAKSKVIVPSKSKDILNNYERLVSKLRKRPIIKRKWTETQEPSFFIVNDLDNGIWSQLIPKVVLFCKGRKIDASKFNVLENIEIKSFGKRSRLDKSFKTARLNVAKSALALCRKINVIINEENRPLEHDFVMSKGFPKPIIFNFVESSKMKQPVREALEGSFLLLIPRVKYSSDCRLVFVVPARNEIILEENSYRLNAILEERYGAKDGLLLYEAKQTGQEKTMQWLLFMGVQKNIEEDLEEKSCILKKSDIKLMKNIQKTSGKCEEEEEGDENEDSSSSSDEDANQQIAASEELRPQPETQEMEAPRPQSEMEEAAPQEEEEGTLSQEEEEEEPGSGLKRKASDDGSGQRYKRPHIEFPAAELFRDTYCLQHDIRENGIHEKGSFDTKDPHFLWNVVGANPTEGFSLSKANEKYKRVRDEEWMRRFKYFNKEENRHDALSRLCELDAIYSLFSVLLNHKAPQDSGYESDTDEFASPKPQQNSPDIKVPDQMLKLDTFQRIFQEYANGKIIKPLLQQRMLDLKQKLEMARSANDAMDQRTKHLIEERDQYKNLYTEENNRHGMVSTERDFFKERLDQTLENMSLFQQQFAEKEAGYTELIESQRKKLEEQQVSISLLEQKLWDFETKNLSFVQLADTCTALSDASDNAARQLTPVCQYFTQLMTNVPNLTKELESVVELLKKFSEFKQACLTN